MKLSNLIENVNNNPNSELFFEGIMTIGEGTKGEYYIDPRTYRHANGLNVVTPFCFHGGEYWYICPDCGQIHIAHGFGKRETGCCEDIDCKRVQVIGGEPIFIQRDPIIILDEEGQ